MSDFETINPEKVKFFEDLETQHIALTFDDVRERTASGRLQPLPEQIDTTSKFSTNVTLKIPFVSAAMTSVTEGQMAIAMAKEGGLGIIHAAMSIDEQRKEVRRVKKDVNSLIEEPICVRDNQSLESIMRMCDERKFDFRTFPVLDSEGRFVGILSGNDFKYPERMSEIVQNVMTPAERVTSSAEGTSSEDAYKIMQREHISTLPVINEDRGVSGLFLWSDVSRVHRESAKYNVDHNGQLIVGAAVSTSGDVIERVSELQRYADVIVLDSADGDSFYAFQTLEKLKSNFDIDIVVGNISEGESAFELAEAGADGIKVGQGPGSICTTRAEMGIGMPQVTAVYNCVKALREKYPHVPICADGGIKEHGDISIAIAAGAHAVMMGKMLAGTTESPGPIMVKGDGSRYKNYWGMGSAKELRENAASRERYGARDWKLAIPEGIESRIPYEGDLKDVLGVCVRALVKSMRYVKSPDITAHRLNTRFTRITNAGLRESHPHDVEVITH